MIAQLQNGRYNGAQILKAADRRGDAHHRLA